MGINIPNESETENLPLLQTQLQTNTDNSLIQQTCLESKKLWHIAAPSIFSRLTMFSITVVTQSFAGHLNDLDLAAISIACTLLIAITFGFLLGMASALETLCGQAYGAGQYHMLGVYLQQQAGLVAIWLIPFHLSFPFQFTLQRFLQCQLKTAVIAWVSGGALVIHVIVSWVFVYKLRIGIVGIALTIDFSWWVSVIGMLVYTLFGGCRHSWTGFSVEAFVGLWDFFKLSLASGVMLALENFYYRMLLIMSGYMYNSDVAIDALSVCVTIYGWESMIPLGFLAATGVRVANELGAGNAKGAKFATMVSVVNTVLAGFIFWLIIVLFNEKLALIFTSNLSVIKMVNELSILLAFTILLNCIQPVLSGVAIGSGRQAVVAYINIGSYYLVGIPLGILLGWLLPSGIVGMWTGMMSGTVVQTLILVIITSRYDWEREVRKARILVKDDTRNNLIML
ncbi:hypothetical protein P8452_28580 [Trifolium repens]|nr:hypothetical protein P8452_28580 [Trifolium repens]